MEEKIYTIPLMRAKMAPRTKRAKKAIKLIKEYLARHTKGEIIKIDKSINEAVWARGLRKVPSKIRVKAVKVEEEIWAYTPEAEVKIKEEKKKEKKVEEKEVEEEVREEKEEGEVEEKEVEEEVREEKEEGEVEEKEVELKEEK